ncbi:hypothetical protein GQ53DRAFT_122142 [Thozetella sp. PMI_491]|nr:hypothetical protein GQ53DRAFT_122142 [Thozetella sp. PMI_491]
MDVFSTVAGAFQLAAQLGQAVLSIKNLIERTSRAPSEVRHLASLCEQVSQLSRLLECLVVDPQLPSSPRYDPGVIKVISWALETCCDKISSINILVRKSSYIDSSHTLLRGAASIRFAFKSRQIAEIEGQLNTAIIVLNWALQVGQILHSDSNKHRTASDPTSRSVVTVNSIVPPNLKRSSSQWEPPSRRAPTPKDRSFVLRAPSSISIDSKTAGSTVALSSPDYNNRFDINLISQTLFEVRFTQTNRGLSNFVMKPISPIPWETETELKEIFFQKDLDGLQRLLENKLVNLDSVNSQGKSLLSFAQVCLDEQGAVFLAKQGCKAVKENVELSASCPSLSQDSFRVLCWHARDDLNDCFLDDIFLDADDIINVPERFQLYLLNILDITTLKDDEVLGSALLVAARAWAYVLYDLISQPLRERELADMIRKRIIWEGLVKWTIELGATLHYLDKYEFSVLGNFILRFHPVDCLAIMTDWIHLLQECKKDVNSYLSNEARLYERAKASATQRLGGIGQRAVKMLLDYDHDPSVEVTWYVDSEGTAALVLQEFSGLGDGGDDCCWLEERGDVKTDCLCSWPFPCSLSG